MSVIEEVRSSQGIAQEIDHVMSPMFCTDTLNFVKHPSTLSRVYSSGLYNMKNGKTVITDKGKMFFKELSKVKFSILSMKIERGWRCGIGFKVRTSLAQETVDIRYDNSDRLNTWGADEVARLAVILQINKVTDLAIEFMESNRSLARFRKGASARRLLSDTLEYSQAKYDGRDGFHNRGASNYIMSKFLKLDFGIKTQYGTVEEAAERNKEQFINEKTDRTFFESGSSRDIPMIIKIGMLYNNMDKPEHDDFFHTNYMDKDDIIAHATQGGLVEWTDGKMSFTEMGPVINQAYEEFKEKFVHFFTDGRWRISTYDLRYGNFTVEYLPNNVTIESRQNLIHHVMASATSNDTNLLRFFKMFNVMDTLITSLLKSLSIDMVTEMAAVTLKQSGGNMREIIGLMTEKMGD